MTQIKLALAMMQVENVIKLSDEFEFSNHLKYHLVNVNCELKRQLTNLTHSSKIKE